MTVETDGTASFSELEARARAFEADEKLKEARDAYEAALRLNPASRSCSEGRARVSIQLNEDDAAEHCAHALAFYDHDPQLQEQMIATAAASLGAAALPLLLDFVERHPHSTGSHELLAELRAQAGDGDRFVASYLAALRRYPDSKALLMSYWDTLTRAGRLAEALESMDAKRSLFEGDRAFAMLEVNAANHAGLTDRAGAILDRIDSQADAQLARGQHRLQIGCPDEAAKLLEDVTRVQPDNLSAWALLELAWRLTGDDRHDWLVRPGLIGEHRLALSDAQLADIAAALRTIHQARAQPLGQSVRGGTQTLGQLFLRREPEILLLADALVAAIRDFVAALPPVDPHHPLLRHRDQGIAFGPSWSVRLSGGGYHEAHFHPGGILSSACYISLPEEVSDSSAQAGWLEIGRPPPELGIDLPPLTSFQPKAGHLILFPSFLFHGTRRFGGGERLTVAFDLVPVPPS